jgi:hypothetical protein
MAAAITSELETCRDLIASASSVALMRHSSVAVVMLMLAYWRRAELAAVGRCFSADIKTPSRWTPITAPEGPRLKTTLCRVQAVLGEVDPEGIRVRLVVGV